MKNKQVFKRLTAGILAAAVAVSAVVLPAAAENGVKLNLREVSGNGIGLVRPDVDKLKEIKNDVYADDDVVRVSIFLNDASTINAGFDIDTIATNSKAIAYRNNLKDKQAAVAKKIENTTSEKLDVVHNLTLAANIISANVKYGQIKKIEKISGVKSVVIETQYEPAKTVEELPDNPNMSTSYGQIGSNVVWAEGYTGAGTQIAVIDTGIATDHLSFNNEAYLYSLEEIAKEKGMTLEEYKAALDLLDAEDIEKVKDQLNVQIDVSKVTVSEKIPFAYNYVDLDYDVTHKNDTQGEHGSHVEGISAANKYIKDENGQFVSAIDKVKVQGVAPDAQIITMKVFGKNGGAYDSDYMLAIEDAIVLGAESINLSLGSANGGDSKLSTAEYQKIFDDLANCGSVVTISAGNAGHWADNAYTNGYLYADDVSTQTNGSPGSYTNAFTVASSDNKGTYGEYITIGGNKVVYNQSTDYGNKPFATLAGEQEYVYIDGVGTPEDWAAVGEALKGKIAICSRGQTSFFEKANAAVEAGAAGVIIYNNTSGTIGLNLSGYLYEAPVVSILQSEAAYFKANATSSANGAYYTGKMTVSADADAVITNTGYSAMSTFSSWGVPGSLELKPEIAAPGGNIYSVNGMTNSQYENMSGTSMAAPQVAGMSALAAQYIKENGLEEKTGLKARTLAQSLLMSTAVPMLNDTDDDLGISYYPLLQQGAGEANIGNVVKAESYILMDEAANAGAKDGKVKVELGDDPDKKGVYEFGFTIYNLTESAKAYILSADMFTQGIFADEYEDLYMDTATVDLTSETVFDCGEKVVVPASGKVHVKATVTLSDKDKEYLAQFVNGAYVEGFVYAAPYMMYDFNGDGKVTVDDGQRILDYRTGVSTEITNKEYADMDGDKDIDTYDAYLFLDLLETGKLDIFDGEGILGTTHSIPVFGFYGNWSTASMFDKGSYVEYYLSGTEGRIPYLAAATGLSSLAANAFGITYKGEGPAPFGGNLMTGGDSDELGNPVYYPERNAVNSNDTVLSQIQFAVIRNASGSKFLIKNLTTGEIITDQSLGAFDAAFYHDNSGAWMSTGVAANPNYNFAGTKENETLEFTLALAPEYYAAADGTIRWEDVDMTNALSITATVDNTAPKIDKAVVDGNKLIVTATDNQYISYIALTNKGGTKVYAESGSLTDAQPGKAGEFVLDVTGVNADQLYLQVFDYAMNATVYAVPEAFGEGTTVSDAIAYDAMSNTWVSYNADKTGYAELEGSDYTFTAATIADHIVYAADENSILYTMPEKDLSDVTRVVNLSNFFGENITVCDMAYNAADGNIYAVVNEMYLVPINKLTGNPLGFIPLTFPTTTLAIDGDGNFYSNVEGTGIIVTYTLETLTTDGAAPDVVCEVKLDENTAYTPAESLMSMEYNPNTGLIGWNGVQSVVIDEETVPMASYFEINPADGSYKLYFSGEEFINVQLTSLIYPDKSTESKTPDWAAPTDEILGGMIDVLDPEITMIKGSTMQLSIDVFPWTAKNKDVSWISTDDNIASVDANGVVTAISSGTVNIAAVSKATLQTLDTVKVTVETVDVTIEGGLQDANGNPLLFKWNLNSEESWNKVADLKTSLESITLNNKNGRLYIMDNSEFNMYEVDPKDGTVLNTSAGLGGPLYDIAYSDMFSTEEAPMIVGINGGLVLLSDPMNLNLNLAVDLSRYLEAISGADTFIGIANMGKTYLNLEEYQGDAEEYWLLDNTGTLWIVYIGSAQGTPLIIPYYFYPDVIAGEAFGGLNQYSYGASMVKGDDGMAYVSVYSVEDNRNNIYRLEADGEEIISQFIGCTEDNVWPMVMSKVTKNAAAAAETANNEIAASRKTLKASAGSKAELIGAEKSGFVKIDAVAFNAEPVEASKFMKLEKVALAYAAESDTSKATKPAADEAVIDGITVTIPVIAKDDKGNTVESNNGLYRVTYDTEKLEYKSVEKNADYISVNAQEGKIIVGYVNPVEALKAGEKAVDLVFTVKEGAELDSSSAKVAFVENNATNADKVDENGNFTPEGEGSIIEVEPIPDPEAPVTTAPETEPTVTDDTTEAPVSDDTTAAEAPVSDVTTAAAGADGDGNDKPIPTGMIIAVVPAIASAAAVIISKKRK